MKPEDRLATQVDALRLDQAPAEPLDAEEAELLAMARLVKRLGRPADPSLDFARRMNAAALPPRRRRWLALPAAVAVVTAVALGLTFNPFAPSYTVVQAMEQKVAQIDSYHAVIEHRYQYPNPTMNIIKTEEVWFAGDRYAWNDPGVQEVISDGEHEWRVNHEMQAVWADFPLTPLLHPFQPANLIKAVADLPYVIEGHDEIAGRPTTRVRFKTPDFESYRIWIENQTKLPLQIEMKFWDGMVTTTAYKTFELNLKIDPSHFTAPAYAGYRVESNGRRVATIAEAAALAGFQPILPQESPKLIVVRGHEITMGFGDVAIAQQATPYKLVANQRQSYGWSGIGPVQTGGKSDLWWNQGVGIHVSGSERTVDLARQIAPDITLPYEPYRNPYLISLIEEPVKVDMEAAMAAEVAHAQNFAAGSDRYFALGVAKRFVQEQGAAVPESAFREAGNNRAEAIVTVSEGPISKVYLRRVARQDDQGLWWVIGYDRR